jgi:arabinogalactan oligomer / maltooligosaccharide transport system permease protein
LNHSNSLEKGKWFDFFSALKYQPYLYLLPAFIVIALISFFPLGYGFWLSFTNMSLGTFKNPVFIGIKNYLQIFKDVSFFSTLWRTIVWTAVNVTFHVVLGIALAVLLNRKLPGRALFRVFLIIPWAMPQYIAALTWRGMLNLNFGAINIALEKTGLGRELFFGGILSKYPIPWLTDAAWLFRGAIITNVWLGVPFMMMVALGGLQSIPSTFYEAAEMDGATGWQKFRNITLPMMKPIMAPAVVLGVVWTFNMLNVILILAGSLGGYGFEGAQILVTEVYRQAFSFYRYGYAAAYSALIFVILLAFVIAFMRYFRGIEDVR